MGQWQTSNRSDVYFTLENEVQIILEMPYKYTVHNALTTCITCMWLCNTFQCVKLTFLLSAAIFFSVHKNKCINKRQTHHTNIHLYTLTCQPVMVLDIKSTTATVTTKLIVVVVCCHPEPLLHPPDTTTPLLARYFLIKIWLPGNRLQTGIRVIQYTYTIVQVLD